MRFYPVLASRQGCFPPRLLDVFSGIRQASPKAEIRRPKEGRSPKPEAVWRTRVDYLNAETQRAQRYAEKLEAKSLSSLRTSALSASLR